MSFEPSIEIESRRIFPRGADWAQLSLARGRGGRSRMFSPKISFNCFGLQCRHRGERSFIRVTVGKTSCRTLPFSNQEQIESCSSNFVTVMSGLPDFRCTTSPAAMFISPYPERLVNLDVIVSFAARAARYLAGVIDNRDSREHQHCKASAIQYMVSFIRARSGFASRPDWMRLGRACRVGIDRGSLSSQTKNPALGGAEGRAPTRSSRTISQLGVENKPISRDLGKSTLTHRRIAERTGVTSERFTANSLIGDG